MAKDALDELLEKEAEEAEKEETEKETDDKSSTSDDKKGAEPTLDEKLATATAKIGELEKGHAGLRSGITSERTKRQDVEGRLSQLSETLNDIISRRKEAGEEKKATGIKVEVDDDGNAFIPEEAISGRLEKAVSAISDKLDKLSADTTKRTEEDDREKESQKVYGKIVAEDGTYQDASRILGGMVEWVDERLIPLLKEQGIETQPSAGQILDMLDETNVEKDFQAAYPGVEMDNIVRAFSSKRDYRSALKHLSKESDKKSGDGDDKEKAAKLKALLKKSSSLGDVRNQKTTTGLTLDQIANIDPEDFENLSDAEAEKLEQFLKKEEERG